MLRNIKNTVLVVLVFIGTTNLFSCESENSAQGVDISVDSSKIVTSSGENLTVTNSVEDKLKYVLTTPMLETYSYAKEPYTEYRKGLHIKTFNDSTFTVESELEADYAINYEHLKLWEAKGNVVAKNANGQRLETQQLFWDQTTKKIYSNVDSKVIQGEDVLIGEGFESDESMENFVFRKPKGRISFEMDNESDSTSIQQPNEIPSGNTVQ